MRFGLYLIGRPSGASDRRQKAEMWIITQALATPASRRSATQVAKPLAKAMPSVVTLITTSPARIAVAACAQQRAAPLLHRKPIQKANPQAAS